jgi:hypothetical protein
MLLTGMHYPHIQKALNSQKISAQDLTCEGMGCQFIMRGTDMDLEMREIAGECPHFEPLRENEKKYLGIDSHANINKYPEPSYLTVKNGKTVIVKLRELEKKA